MKRNVPRLAALAVVAAGRGRAAAAEPADAAAPYRRRPTP